MGGSAPATQTILGDKSRILRNDVLFSHNRLIRQALLQILEIDPGKSFRLSRCHVNLVPFSARLVDGCPPLMRVSIPASELAEFRQCCLLGTIRELFTATRPVEGSEIPDDVDDEVGRIGGEYGDGSGGSGRHDCRIGDDEPARGV